MPGATFAELPHCRFNMMDSSVWRVMLLTVDPTDEVLQCIHLQLDAGLSECVAVLNAVE